jgi:hypothetical protein
MQLSPTTRHECVAASILTVPSVDLYRIGLKEKFNSITSPSDARLFPDHFRQVSIRTGEFLARLLYNHTHFTLERRLQFEGLEMMILPIRVFSSSKRQEIAP